MRYTLLRVTSAGIVLREYHVRRLELGASGAAAEAFARFGDAAEPGVWAVWVEGPERIRTERRAGSRLRDGIATRLACSPIANKQGTIPKPPPPCVYDPVRSDGVATLLTSADGAEIYEACSAAVLGWDGERVVCVPGDRPRVWSTAEAAVREHLPVTEAPIPVRATMPILLVNAVKGTCGMDAPGRDAFPVDVRSGLDHLFESLFRFTLARAKIERC